jgi:ribosomal 30S subunit maturation factor RimM
VDDGEREHLVPFTATLVRKVDLEAGRIVIEPLPGLFDL